MDKYIVEKSKDNYDILKIVNDNRSIYIGSKYNEKREIDKFINLAGEMTEKDNYVVLGLGTGNHIKELIKAKHNQAKILVIECEKEWSNKLNFKYKDVIVAKSIEDIQNFLYNYVNEFNIHYLKIIPYANYNKIYEKDIAHECKYIKEYFEKLIININTKIKFHDIWFEFRIKNLKYLCESTYITELKGKYRNKPAIIVSAGPSLSKNIECLKDNKNALIISGGRTLKSLLGINVIPDYVTIIDPSEYSYALVKDYIGFYHNTLIYMDNINNKILNKHKGKKIILSDNKKIERIYIEEHIKKYSGGSVSHTMTELAILMGCNPIIFIGQDFAYTNDKGHADIASSPWKRVNIKNYEEDDDVYVKSLDGSIVRTSKYLNLFKKNMEYIIDEHKHIEFINATEGGALIKGAENKTLKETLENINYSLDNSNTVKEKIHENIIVKNKIINCIKNTIVNINKINKLTIEILHLLKKAEQSIKFDLKNKQYIFYKLEKLEEKYTNIEKGIYFFEEILYPIIYEVNYEKEYIIKNNDNNINEIIKQIKRKELYYSKINNIYIEKIEFIKKCFNEIEQENIKN